MLLAMLLALAVQSGEPIETCRIIKLTDEVAVLMCKEDKTTGAFSGYVGPRSKWPKEWEDATKVDDQVKLQPTKDGGFIPIASCKARIAKAEEEARRNRGERRMPLNWYVPKDCQGDY